MVEPQAESLMDSRISWRSLWQGAPALPGVYVVMRGDTVLYVGKTGSLAQRFPHRVISIGGR
jgi:excinuclease UvrABC nuclease subunit